MQEEFHADRSVTPIQYKLLYGWTPLNTNVWLPSLSELVGIDPNTYADGLGTYYSAMQGLNVSVKYWTDSKGGDQFAYFKQFNASGGGEKIWDACNRQFTWLRSSGCSYPDDAWRVNGAFVTNGAPKVTASGAVHPVVDASSISLASACGESSFIPLFFLVPAKQALLGTLYTLATTFLWWKGVLLPAAIPTAGGL